jgi:hypothetical protein
LVSDIPAGDGKNFNLFYSVAAERDKETRRRGRRNIERKRMRKKCGGGSEGGVQSFYV